MTQPDIVLHKSCVSLQGEDATRFYAAIHVKQALLLYSRTKMLMTRNATPTVLLRAAESYTGHKYKRGAYAEAAKDLSDWIETMRAALQIEDQR